MGAAVLLSRRLRDSRIGWAWQAIREDELAAQAMGINTTAAKLQAFAIGAAFAGAGGAFLASWQRSVFPDNFLFTESVNILAMVILGGVGSLPGVILGAALIVALPEVFRDFALYRMLAFGLSADDPHDLPSGWIAGFRRSARRGRPIGTDAGLVL